jgi:hypothetical protein
MLRPALFVVAVLGLTTLALHPAAPPRTSVHLDTRADLADVSLSADVEAAQDGSGGPDGLPVTWCGQERTDDDAPDAAWPPTAARFKVVYAYAADRPDQFALWQDALQADVAVAERFLSAQSGGRKALRFDMGTSCGPQYADIQTVQLPGPATDYQGNFSAIANAVDSALGPAGGPRDAVILADGLSATTVEYGLGETIMGDSGEQPGPKNPHNGGGLSAVLFPRQGDVPGAGAHGWWPEGFLHEITHNLGAVQWGAPHSTEPPGQQNPAYGHCWQGADVMCYLEDAGAAHAMQIDCQPIEGVITESYDCGRDDYFSPDPAAGSYLATHWNTYDSAFMAPCGQIAPACGGGELWVPKPPAPAAAPTVAGAARHAIPLYVSTGSWLNAPSGYTYQWQRLTRTGWTDIDDADGSRYTPTMDDLGRRLRAVVIAANGDGQASAISTQTAPVGALWLLKSKLAAQQTHHKKKKHRRSG